MRILFLKLLLISPLIGFSQSEISETTIDSVSFKVKVNLKNATKDGIYLKGYVVNIPFEDLKKLDGKTIEVNGIATIEKRLENDITQYDKNGNKIIKQGRSRDTKHIQKPKYHIIKE
ncbi:hypothetical protein [Gaetbulibacter jejuensis]|uniref:Uncharacterized protein n=1 Tax=Gaetbulibacter jejuensis TaxID=584607 RepID=A0ABN1JEI1_9FLAO